MSDALQQARTAISNLLDALGVAKVICVDDVYARPWTDEDLVVAQAALTEADLQSIFERPQDVFPEDRAVRQQSFREAWAAVDPGKRDNVAKRILTAAAAKKPDEPSDVVASQALADLVDQERLVTVRPSEWPAAKAKIKEEKSANRTLLLFDQDLSGDGGGADGGMVLAQDALTDDDLGTHVMCGLLTHKATIETQRDKWIELAQPPLDQDRFIVVAKSWLSRDPLGFARMLKLVALGPDCRAMKLRSKQLLDKATAEAHSAIDKIHIDDFDSMVFRASKQEGMWEPDMLFRLFGIYHRAAVRRLAYTDNDLKQLSARLRSVSEIPTHSPTATPLTTWKVQRQELYEDGDYINSLHLPLEVGDIFARTDGQSEKFYIVLGQPCDLMVRSDGKRSPEGTDVILADIFGSQEAKPYSVLLPHFSKDDPGKKYYVRLRPIHSVHPCVLDLCVYNSDGTSRLDLDTACPAGVLPSWKAKHEYLKRHAQSLMRRYESFGEGKVKDKPALSYMKTESPKQFPVFTSNTALFKASMSFVAGARQLSFNCKRVMRLQAARTLAISMDYVHCLTRPAFDRDLGS